MRSESGLELASYMSVRASLTCTTHTCVPRSSARHMPVCLAHLRDTRLCSSLTCTTFACSPHSPARHTPMCLAAQNKPHENKEQTSLQYTLTVDTWAVGVLTYELLVGFPPFNDNQRAGIEQKIRMETPRFPSTLTELARNFMLKALQKDALERPTINELLTHPWVRGHRRNASSRNLNANGAVTAALQAVELGTEAVDEPGELRTDCGDLISKPAASYASFTSGTNRPKFGQTLLAVQQGSGGKGTANAKKGTAGGAGALLRPEPAAMSFSTAQNPKLQRAHAHSSSPAAEASGRPVVPPQRAATGAAAEAAVSLACVARAWLAVLVENDICAEQRSRRRGGCPQLVHRRRVEVCRRLAQPAGKTLEHAQPHSNTCTQQRYTSAPTLATACSVRARASVMGLMISFMTSFMMAVIVGSSPKHVALTRLE
eukprot:363466-Chlamydomonas_euryale.AAC.4